VDLGDVLRAVRHGWWLLLVGAAVGLAAAAVVSRSSTPLYTSSTQLFVSATAWTGPEAAYTGDSYAQERAASFAQVLRDERLTSGVVSELGLDLTPVQVAREVTPTVVPRTAVIDVTVTDTSAARARDIAASLGRQFTQWASQTETAVGTSTPLLQVTTLSAPELEPDPVSPDVARDAGLGAALGLLAGLGLAAWRTRSPETVSTEDDVRAHTGAELLGVVPEDPQLGIQHLATGPDEHSSTADALRAIRTSIQLFDVTGPSRVVLVTGTAPGDGASTLAVAAAAALARTGSRVALVDADLRRSQLAERLGLAAGAGLTDVLTGTATLSDATRRWADPGLTIVPAGRPAADPGDALTSPRMEAVLTALRTTHDYVVLDTPPVGRETDAIGLSVLADGCLLVARSARTRRAQLAEAATVLAGADAVLVGVVLDRVLPTTGTARTRSRRYTADRARGGRDVARRPHHRGGVPVAARTPRREDHTSKHRGGGRSDV
jgi:receptor protein-tyrosine kinase